MHWWGKVIQDGEGSIKDRMQTIGRLEIASAF